ncbi:MAG: ThiF family adenylyltransferase [Thiobacillaceae bacterium]
MSDLFPGQPSFDRERRFGGVRRLYGAGSLERLQRARVCVVGVGGVGSWTAEALARSGVGHLTLIDPDHVAESNINRQVHALEGTLGMAKVQAMAGRIRAIHPGCEVRGVEEFLDADNVARLLDVDFDAVVDAIDAGRAKTALVVHCRQRHLPLICVGGAGGRRDPTRVRIADLAQTAHDPLLARLRANLRRWHGYPREPGRRFGIPCVFSTEPLSRPRADGGACYERPDDGRLHGLNCAGYGSSVCVTATFGLMAAAHTIERLLEKVR